MRNCSSNVLAIEQIEVPKWTLYSGTVYFYYSLLILNHGLYLIGSLPRFRLSCENGSVASVLSCLRAVPSGLLTATANEMDNGLGPVFVPSFGVLPLPPSPQRMIPAYFPPTKSILLGGACDAGAEDLDSLYYNVRRENATDVDEAISVRVLALFRAIGFVGTIKVSRRYSTGIDQL